MTFTVNKEVLERHVAQEISELKSSRFNINSSFAIHTEEGCQVQVLITKEEDEIMDAENDYTREANTESESS